MVTALENYTWFKENLSELVKQYADLYIAIKDKSVVGAFKSMRDATAAMSEREQPGTYIIQLCTQDEKKTTQVFHSRVRLVNP